MSFVSIRNKYAEHCRNAQRGTHEYDAYSKVLNCMYDARSLADARESVEALLEGTSDPESRKIYEAFLQEKLNYTNIEQIKEDNRRIGETWFGPTEMRKFRSRVGEKIYGGKYFITSEKDDHNPRRWTIRTISEGGVIKVEGDRMGYTSWGSADRAATNLAEEKK